MFFKKLKSIRILVGDKCSPTLIKSHHKRHKGGDL